VSSSDEGGERGHREGGPAQPVPPAGPGYPPQPGYPPRPPDPGRTGAPGLPGPDYGGRPGYPPSQPPAYPSQPAYGSPPPPPGYGYTGPPPAPVYPARPGQPGQPGYPPPPGYPGQPPAYGGYPPAYPGAGYDGGAPAGRRSWSGLAIAAFVTACIPWIGILAAVPLGIVALVKIGKSRQRGKGLAITGMVISVLIWVATIGIGIAVYNNTASRDSNGHITEAGRINFADIRTGDCVQIDGINSGKSVGLLDVQGVPCSSRHDAESVGDVVFGQSVYPGYSTLTEQARVQCTQLASQYVDPAQVAGLQPYLFAPSESLWNSDDGTHRVVCLVTKSDYSSLTGSVAR
jgi:hypothetical protein